jgi:alpha-1,2-mannosyltransferase
VTAIQESTGVRYWATVDVRQLDPRTRARAVAVAVAVIAGFTGAAYVVYSKFGPHHFQYDLKIYYNATSFWLSGHNLYDYWQPDPVNGTLGFTYPPAAAVLMAPMHVFSLSSVVDINFLAIIAAGFGCVALWLRERLSLGWLQMLTASAAATAVAFCFQPFAQNIAFGQINLYLALLVTADLLVLVPRGSRWAGVGIGISMAVKLTPGIFLLYLVLARNWRAAGMAAASCAAVTVFSALIAPKETLRYFPELLWQSGRVGLLDNTTNQSVNGLLARLSSDGVPSGLAWLCLSAVIVVIGGRRIRQAFAAQDKLGAMILTGLVGVLVSPVSWIHHAVWYVGIALIMVSYLWRARPVVNQLTSSLTFSSLAARRTWVLNAVLFAVGLFVWFKDTRVVFGLPDTGYAGLGPIAIIEGSLQMLWMVAALLVLPIGTSHSDARPTQWWTSKSPTKRATTWGV